MTILPESYEPPRCPKHNRRMMLGFYERPGGPQGNGWICPICQVEREKEPIAGRKCLCDHDRKVRKEEAAKHRSDVEIVTQHLDKFWDQAKCRPILYTGDRTIV